MSLLRKIVDAINPSSITKPIFIKENSDAQRQLEHLKSLYEMAVGDTRTKIETDIRYLNQGIIGENQIEYELKNSHLPMLVLHDLNLYFEGLSAQIDYVIILRTIIVIIECKNLFGNIEINADGDFIRTMAFNGIYRKECIYSPITQNIRHLELIKKARLSTAKGFIDRLNLEKGLSRYYKSIVVLANPKTVLNTKYAKRDVKNQIIKADQLVSYLKRLSVNRREDEMSDEQMYNISDFFLSFNHDVPKDYTSKYQIDLNPVIETTPEPVKIIPVEDTEIYKALKEYRLLKSREKNIKAYYIFNNTQLEKIINSMPRTLNDLNKISGLGHQSIKNYGAEILKIVNKYD